MYAVLTTFFLNPGMSSVMFERGDQIAELFRSAKGLERIAFFGNDKTGEYGGFSIWESKEEAEEFTNYARPRLREMLKDVIKGPATTKVFFVFEPEF
jgi:heme-degrading monooxygenase HmoA